MPKKNSIINNTPPQENILIVREDLKGPPTLAEDDVIKYDYNVLQEV